MLACGRFSKRAINVFNILKTYLRVTTGTLSMFISRISLDGEKYFAQMNLIPAAKIEGCCSQNIVSDALFCIWDPLLVAELGYLDKRTPYWTDYVHRERLMPAKYGLSILYQCMMALEVRVDFRFSAFHR